MKKLVLAAVLSAAMAMGLNARDTPTDHHIVQFEIVQQVSDPRAKSGVAEEKVGDVFIELYPSEAPLTVANFLQYVEDGFYDGTIFHRVINGFVLQGGGFESGMVPKKTREPIQNEANNGLKNTIGTLSMARTRAVNSATSQFFINVADNDFLDYRSPTAAGYGYCVFGKVIDGMDVVNKLKSVRTTRSGVYSDVPQKDIKIKSAKVILKRGKKEKKNDYTMVFDSDSIIVTKMVDQRKK